MTKRNTLILTNSTLVYGEYSINLTKGSWESITENLRIFGYLNSKGVEIPMDRYNIVLYGGKIYDNNILVRNFVPCYRKADNAIGLYDIVNKQFYDNNGTGRFVKGEDVNKPIQIELKGKNLFNYKYVRGMQNAVRTQIDNGYEITKGNNTYALIVYMDSVEIEDNTTYRCSIDCAFLNSIDASLRPNEMFVYLSNSKGGITVTNDKLIGITKLGTHTELTTKRFSFTTTTGYKYAKFNFYGNVAAANVSQDYKAILKNIMFTKDNYPPY